MSNKAEALTELDKLASVISLIPNNAKVDVHFNSSETLHLFCTDKESIKTMIRWLGQADKDSTGSDIILRGKKDGIKVCLWIAKNLTCKKVKKTIEVPAQPAREAVPAHTEEVEEWECPESLLEELERGDYEDN